MSGRRPEDLLAEQIDAERDPELRSGLIHTLANYLVASVWAEREATDEDRCAAEPRTAPHRQLPLASDGPEETGS